MKGLKIFATILVALFTLTVSADAQTNKKKAKAALEEVTFAVSIHCADCKAKCDANLPYIKGVKDFNVSVEDQTIWFKYDPTKITKQKLAAEIAELGYPGEEIKKEVKE